jgi:hypothetical protein
MDVKISPPLGVVEKARALQYANRSRIGSKEIQEEVKKRAIVQASQKKRAEGGLEVVGFGGQLEFEKKGNYKIWTIRRTTGEGWFIGPTSNQTQEVDIQGLRTSAIVFDEEEFASNNYIITRYGKTDLGNTVNLASMIQSGRFSPLKLGPPVTDRAIPVDPASRYQFLDLTHARKDRTEYAYSDFVNSTLEFFVHLDHDEKEYIPTFVAFRDDESNIIFAVRIKEYTATFLCFASVSGAAGGFITPLMRITRNQLMPSASHPSYTGQALNVGLAKKWRISIVDDKNGQAAKEATLQVRPKNHIMVKTTDKSIELYADGQFVDSRPLDAILGIGESRLNARLSSISFYYEAYSAESTLIVPGSENLAPPGFDPGQDIFSADVPSASFSEYRFTPRRLLYPDTFGPPEGISGLA